MGAGVLMRMPNQIRVAQALMIAVILLFGATSWSEVRQMAIVARSDFPNNKISKEELKAIYLGEIQILHGVRILPIDQPHRQPIREAFLSQILKMTRDQYLEYWNKRLYQKGGLTPLLEENPRKVIEAVQEKEGALGYVWAEELQKDNKIKVLLTIDLKE
jgi:ABC-type phosphate transport system substrate-binding protein